MTHRLRRSVSLAIAVLLGLGVYLFLQQPQVIADRWPAAIPPTIGGITWYLLTKYGDVLIGRIRDQRTTDLAENDDERESLKAAWTEIRSLRTDLSTSDDRNTTLWTTLQRERVDHETVQQQLREAAQLALKDAQLQRERADAAEARETVANNKVDELTDRVSVLEQDVARIPLLEMELAELRAKVQGATHDTAAARDPVADPVGPGTDDRGGDE